MLVPFELRLGRGTSFAQTAIAELGGGLGGKQRYSYQVVLLIALTFRDALFAVYFSCPHSHIRGRRSGRWEYAACCISIVAHSRTCRRGEPSQASVMDRNSGKHLDKTQRDGAELLLSFLLYLPSYNMPSCQSTAALLQRRTLTSHCHSIVVCEFMVFDSAQFRVYLRYAHTTLQEVALPPNTAR